MALLLEATIVPLLAVGLLAQFSSGVNLVEVYATVTGPGGEPISGLQQQEFHVFEDGRPQTIAAFAAGEVPLAIVIALDRSFSMAGARLATAKRATAAFVHALRPDDEVTILAIGSEVETIAPPVPARDLDVRRLDAVDAWGTTPLYDVTRVAIDRIQARRGRRALLIISDGIDRGSETDAATLIAHARRSDVLIYPIAVARATPPVLVELASVTGGRSLTVADPQRLDAALGGLARELRMQYLLGYVPAREGVESAGWHAIDVRVDRPGVRVRARDGYFAR